MTLFLRLTARRLALALTLAGCGGTVTTADAGMHGPVVTTDAGSSSHPEAGTVIGTCGEGGTCPAGAECLYPVGSCVAQAVCVELLTNACKSAEEVPGCDAGSVLELTCSAPGYATGPTTGAALAAGDAGAPDARIQDATSDAADSPDGPPLASAYITATTTNDCNLDDDVSFGTPGMPVITTGNNPNVDDEVSCTVHATGGGSFAIALDVSGESGAVTLSGTVDDGSSADGGMAASLVALHWNGLSGNFTGSSCQLTLSTDLTPAIAPGRIAASLSCPASDAGCGAMATFILQNCTP